MRASAGSLGLLLALGTRLPLFAQVTQQDAPPRTQVGARSVDSTPLKCLAHSSHKKSFMSGTCSVAFWSLSSFESRTRNGFW